VEYTDAYEAQSNELCSFNIKMDDLAGGLDFHEIWW